MICRVCKTENEERFTYCKNCGNKLQKEDTSVFDGETPNRPSYWQQAPVVPAAPETPTLVPVKMWLPDPEKPDQRTLQNVFVTPGQRRAMEQAGLLSGAK